MKLTPEACRAARALLDWNVTKLAEATRLGRHTIARFESGRPLREDNADKIVSAFAAQGVEITNGEGTGARLLRRICVG